MKKSGLENQRVFTGTVGSNPTLSVKQNEACPVGGRTYQFLVDRVLIGGSTSLFAH